MTEREGKGGIPDRLIGEVMRLSGERQSSRQIAAWLAEKHDVVVSHATVARLLKSHREERRETAQAIVQEKLGSPDGLSADLDGIIALRAESAQVRSLALQMVLGSPDPRTIKAWATAAHEYREVVKLGLEIAGLAKPDEGAGVEDAADRVLGRIAGLVEREGTDSCDTHEG